MKTNSYPDGHYGNFLAAITAVRKPAGSQEAPTGQFYVELEVSLECGPPKIVHFLFSELEKLDLENRIPGLFYYSGSAKKAFRQMLREAIALRWSSSELPVYYPSTGLFTEPQPAFAAGSQVLTVSKGANVPVLLEHTLHLTTDTADISAFLDSLELDPSHRLPAFAYTINAHLRSFWKLAVIETAGVLYLIGPQGYGKTTLAENFCTLYDQETSIADKYDALSTPSALRHALADARDRVVLFDDICKSDNAQTRRQRMNNALDLLRLSANGSPIAKKCGNQTISLSCCADLVITGEFLTSEPSELTRCILLNIDKPHSGATAQDRMLASHALSTYLAWLVDHLQEELARASAFLTKWNNSDRMEKNYLQLSFSFDSFLKAITSAVSSQRIHTLSSAADQIFQNCLENQKMYLKKLQAQQQPLLRPLKEYILHGIQHQLLHPRFHDGVPCLTTEELLQFLRRFDPRLQVNTMTELLRKEGLLYMDRSGKSSKKFMGHRYLHLNL